MFPSVAPKIVPFAFEDELEAGSHASLQCSVEQGDTPLSISWIFHGQELSSQMGIETVRIGKRNNLLTIESIAPFHAGKFTCLVSNLAGSTNHSTILIVRGKIYTTTGFANLLAACNYVKRY